ncbi:MAG: cation:proton antiporter [Spirochaetaceae bacterium]|nr:MAG: cation:proton antiporter [Spirochaetaceae bacterium]
MQANTGWTSLNDLFSYLNTHPLFAVGGMLVLGYLLGRTVERLRLPDITGFIGAGLLMGSHVSGIVSPGVSLQLLIIAEVALGLICFTIGAELYLPKLRRVGRQVGWITAGQIGLTFAAVTATMLLLGIPMPFALLLGAIAGTTSPAATVMIVQSLRARGTYVDYLFGTVALGDAAAIMLFSVLLAFVPAAVGIGAAMPVAGLALSTIGTLGLSVLLGIGGGIAIHVIVRRQESGGEVLIVTLGFVLLGTAIATVLRLSPLLLTIAAGATVANISPRNTRVFRAVEPLTPPIYALFFVIAGTKLDPSMVAHPLLLAVGSGFVVARWIGKYTGTLLGARVKQVEEPIARYLGVSLFPQAGVALGLVLMLQLAIETAPLEVLDSVTTSVNIVLFAVFVNEIVGPPLSRMATVKGNRMEV